MVSVAIPPTAERTPRMVLVVIVRSASSMLMSRAYLSSIGFVLIHVLLISQVSPRSLSSSHGELVPQTETIATTRAM